MDSSRPREMKDRKALRRLLDREHLARLREADEAARQWEQRPPPPIPDLDEPVYKP